MVSSSISGLFLYLIDYNTFNNHRLMINLFFFQFKMSYNQSINICIHIISSLSAICPMPLLSAYSASKACVDYFSQCLCLELNDQYPKIFIQSILPGFVATKMSKMSPSRTVPSADSYVHSAILSIGHTNRTFVFILHCLHYKLYQFSNHCFIDIYRRIAYKQMLKLRQKYLRKEALAKCKRIQ